MNLDLIPNSPQVFPCLSFLVCKIRWWQHCLAQEWPSGSKGWVHIKCSIMWKAPRKPRVRNRNLGLSVLGQHWEAWAWTVSQGRIQTEKGCDDWVHRNTHFGRLGKLTESIKEVSSPSEHDHTMRSKEARERVMSQGLAIRGFYRERVGGPEHMVLGGQRTSDWRQITGLHTEKVPADPDKSTFGGRVQTKASQRRVKTGLEAEARAGKSGLCLESCAVPAGARVTGQVRSRFPGETLQRPMMPPRPARPWCSAQGSCEALCLRLGIPFQTATVQSDSPGHLLPTPGPVRFQQRTHNESEERSSISWEWAEGLVKSEIIEWNGKRECEMRERGGVALQAEWARWVLHRRFWWTKGGALPSDTGSMSSYSPHTTALLDFVSLSFNTKDFF